MSTDDTNEIGSEPGRPVAIGGPTGGWDEGDLSQDAPEIGEEAFGPIGYDALEPQRYEPPPVERFFDELIVGVAALALAISVFLPWYVASGFTVLSISGWASGNWGPVVFFLGAAGVAIVGLRLLRVPLSLPYPHGLMLEGLGWAAVGLILLKRFFRPQDFGIAGPFDGGFWLALAAAVGIAMLASRLSKDTPIVLIPGWFRGRAGTIGTAILVVALAGSAAFGMINTVEKARNAALKRDTTTPTTTNNPVPSAKPGYPQCAKDAKFPIPPGVKAVSGQELETPTEFCSADLTSTLSVADVTARYREALREAKWQFQVIGQGVRTGRTVSLTAPKCGTLAIVRAQGQTTTTIRAFFSDQFCEQSRFSPAPSANPSN